jgi:hypothetical protein
MRVALSSGGTVDIQPGSGVEYEIQCIGCTSIPAEGASVQLRGTDGTSITASQGLGAWDNNNVDFDLGDIGLGRRPRLMLDNTNYLVIVETASASIEIVWSGIETK